MSTSARLLRSDVPTDRFQWQRRETPAETPAAPVAMPASAGGVRSALRDLPSPAADRLAAVEQDAFSRGYTAGQADALAATDAATSDLSARLTSAIQDIGLLRPALIRRSEREAVRLAIVLAAHIARREIRDDPCALLVMARHALEQLGGATVATVHLHPDDYAIVAAGLDAACGSGIELAIDPALPRGGCVAQSVFGTIDVGVEAQVRELSRALLESPSGDEETTDESHPR